MSIARAFSVKFLLLALAFVAGFSRTIFAAPTETVSLVLIDGDLREDWPDPGVVAFRRTNTAGPLTVNFTLGGTAAAGAVFTVAPGGTITIPDGDREAWLEFTPTGQALLVAAKSIVVTLQAGDGYLLPKTPAQRTATLTLANVSARPSTKAAVRFLNQAAFGPYTSFSRATMAPLAT